MTVLVTLADAAAWVGLDSRVVLAALRLNGIPFIWLNSESEDNSDDEYFLEIDLDFAMEVGLPIDMNLSFNQKLISYKQPKAAYCEPRSPGQGSGDGTVSKSPASNLLMG